MRRKDRTLTVGGREPTRLDAPGAEPGEGAVGRHWWGRSRSASAATAAAASFGEEPFEDLDERDLDDEIVELLVDEAGSLALARWRDRLGRYIDQQGALDALRLRTSTEPPWPAIDNPMLGYLIERGAEIGNGDGFEVALAWLAANAWFEGVIAERARIARRIDED
jgi:hypothetical protein